jgi:hypothetical protein
MKVLYPGHLIKNATQVKESYVDGHTVQNRSESTLCTLEDPFSLAEVSGEPRYVDWTSGGEPVLLMLTSR